MDSPSENTYTTLVPTRNGLEKCNTTCRPSGKALYPTELQIPVAKSYNNKSVCAFLGARVLMNLRGFPCCALLELDAA